MGRIPRSWNGRRYDSGASSPDKKETAMRSLRTLTLAAGLLGMTPCWPCGQSKTTPEALLNFKPSLKGVEYEAADRPGGDRRLQGRDGDRRQEAADRLRPPRRAGQAPPPVRRHRRQRPHRPVELLPGRLRGLPRDRPQRRQEPRRVPLAECRRHPDRDRQSVPAAKDGSQITGWKRISAEEASKVLVQALVIVGPRPARDGAGHPRGTDGAGRPQGRRSSRSPPPPPKRADGQGGRCRSLARAGTSQTTWNRLDGMMPHLIPADAATGLEAGPGPVRERGDLRRRRRPASPTPTKMAFLQVPEMIKTRRHLEVRRAARAPSTRPSRSSPAEGGIRSSLFREQGTPPGRPGPRGGTPALKALADYDEAQRQSPSRRRTWPSSTSAGSRCSAPWSRPPRPPKTS